MDELKRELEALEDLEMKVQEKTDQAIGAGEKISGPVIEWLEESSNVRTVLRTNWFTDQKAKLTCVQRLCCGYRQPKWSEMDILKMKNSMIDLVARGKNLLCVSFPVNSQGIELVWRGGFVNFESRRTASDNITKALKDDDVHIIGVSGMGGIGKTKLVVEIGKKARDDSLFDQVALAKVSQSPNIGNIQAALAHMLGLTLERDTEAGRAVELQEKLSEIKKVLIILDDVWENIILDSIGIPSHAQHSGCKIILTTRRTEVCDNMCCGLIVPLDVITEAEAWALFIKYAGHGEMSQFYRTAHEVVRECGGLPLALVTVGSALRNKGLYYYQDALRRLSNPDFVDVESDDRDQVYVCLRLSYDYLEDEEAKKCFLLCSLYPEDSEIKVEELTRYAFGLSLFQNVDSVNEARKKIVASVRKLENACLLAPVEHEPNDNFDVYFLERPCMEMHDMVRDVALWINKRNGSPFLVPATMSELQRKHMLWDNAIAFHLKMHSKFRFSCNLEYPNLKILIIKVREDTPFPDDIFEKTSALQILDLCLFHNIQLDIVELKKSPLSSSLLHLENLRVLHLSVQNSSRGLSVIGKLKNLEILSIDSGEYEKLPQEIGELYNLQVLDLSRWRTLTGIPSNLLPKLTKLEELYTPCRATRRQGHNHVDLSELGFLHNLTAFTAKLSGIQCLPQEFRFKKLQSYTISLSTAEWWRSSHWCTQLRNLELDDLNDFSMKAFEQLLPSVQYLKIEGPMHGFTNIFPQVDGAGFQELRKLNLEGSTEIECLIDTRLWGLSDPTSVFSNLIRMVLNRLPNLECLWKGSHQNIYGLHKLEYLELIECDRLTSLFTTSIANSLFKLRHLQISDCGALETIVVQDDNNGSSSYQSSISSKSFLELEEIEIRSCRKLKILLPASYAYQDLPNLASISIQNCAELEQVLGNAGTCVRDIGEIMLNSLISLSLIDLPCLVHLSPVNYHLKVPSLSRLVVEKCPKIIEASFKFCPDCLTLEKNQNFFERVIRDHHQPLLLPITSRLGGDLLCKPFISLHSDQPESTWFSKLQEISILGCHELTSLFSISMVRALQELKSLKIVDCAKLRLILFNDDRSEGKISAEICDAQKISESAGFHKLENLQIECCNELRHVMPVSMAWALSCLKALQIRDCAKLKYIFVDDKPNEKDSGKLELIKLPSLLSLRLYKLPSLVSMASEGFVVNYLGLQNLVMLIADQVFGTQIQAQGECCRVSLGVLPINTPQSCVDLTEVEIGDCCDVKEVFDLNHIQQPVLTKLRVLKLTYMPSLRCIWRGGTKYDIRLSNLGRIEVNYCRTIKSLFTRTVAQTLCSLKTIDIRDCNKLKNIIEPRHPDEQLVLPGSCPLEETCFPQLVELIVTRCDKLESLFPLSMARVLPELAGIQIADCPKLEYIFDDDIGKSTSMEYVQLPELVKLKFIGLSSLRSIAPANFLVSCPCLEMIELVDNAKELSWQRRAHLTNIFIDQGQPSSLSGPIIKESGGIFPLRTKYSLSKIGILAIENYDLQELFDFENVVGHTRVYVCFLTYLGELWLRCLPNLKCIWKGYTDLIDLRELRRVTVTDCMALTSSLFSRSMAVTLESLEVIEVINCKELENIFELTPNQDGALHFVVESISSRTFLKSLKKIKVEGCDKLKSVFSIFIAEYLPMLEEASIKGCPWVEQLFCEDWNKYAEYKGITAPKLKTIQLEDLPTLSCICPPDYTMRYPFIELHMLAIDNYNVQFKFDHEKSLRMQTPESMFSNLQDLFQSCLSNLKSVWLGCAELINLSHLCLLQVNNCIALTNSLFTHTMAQNLCSLEVLEVSNCDRLESIIEPGCVQHVLSRSSTGTYLPKLKKFKIEGCGKLKTLFSVSLAQNLPRLEEIIVKGADQLEKLFNEGQMEEDTGCKVVELPNLLTLHLEQLPCLSCICPAGYTLACQPYLVELFTRECPKIVDIGKCLAELDS